MTQPDQTLREAIAIFSEFAETGGHKEYLGHLDSRLDPHLEALLEAAKKQLEPAPLVRPSAIAEFNAVAEALSGDTFSEAQPAPPAEKSQSDGRVIAREYAHAFAAMLQLNLGEEVDKFADMILDAAVEINAATPKPADTLAADGITDSARSAAFTNYINNSCRSVFSRNEGPAFNAGAKWAEQQTSARLKEAESRGYCKAKDEARARYFEDGLQSFTRWMNEPMSK